MTVERNLIEAIDLRRLVTAICNGDRMLLADARFEPLASSRIGPVRGDDEQVFWVA